MIKEQNQKPNDKEKHPKLWGKISILFLENCNVFMLEEVVMQMPVCECSYTCFHVQQTVSTVS